MTLMSLPRFIIGQLRPTVRAIHQHLHDGKINVPHPAAAVADKTR